MFSNNGPKYTPNTKPYPDKRYEEYVQSKEYVEWLAKEGSKNAERLQRDLEKLRNSSEELARKNSREFDTSIGDLKQTLVEYLSLVSRQLYALAEGQQLSNLLLSQLLTTGSASLASKTDAKFDQLITAEVTEYLKVYLGKFIELRQVEKAKQKKIKEAEPANEEEQIQRSYFGVDLANRLAEYKIRQNEKKEKEALQKKRKKK